MQEGKQKKREVKSMKNVMQRSENKRNNINSLSGNDSDINYTSNN